MTDEQKIAYNRFIKARDRIRQSNKWIPSSDVLSTVDVAGLNHPIFEMNEAYIDYKDAFKQWLAVEPVRERMSMIRGDYDKQDSWKGDK